MLNALVALWGTWLLRPLLPGRPLGLRLRAGGLLLILGAGLVYADELTTWTEEGTYPDAIVYARSTPYQRIVVTGGRAGFQLFLNGHLQCSSTDEYRYHEALVHPALACAGSPRRVLILGGGDGLALREVLRYDSVTAVTLVDIDPDMTSLSQRFPPLGELNRHAFDDRRVTVVNQDAMIWLEEDGEPYDAAVIDFPDPSSYSLGKLYTTRFYRLLKRRLAPGAVVGIQCTSPLTARSAYWCIVRTMGAAGFAVRPYHMTVPSFGVWGFALAAPAPFPQPEHVRADLRFLNDGVLAAMFVFSADTGPVPVEVNRLDNQRLVRYYESEWKKWE
jgi:spermidine synthase